MVKLMKEGRGLSWENSANLKQSERHRELDLEGAPPRAFHNGDSMHQRHWKAITTQVEYNSQYAFKETSQDILHRKNLKFNF